MKIPFIEKEHFFNHKEEEISEELYKVIDSNNFILGENVTKFEKEYAEYCSSKYCVGVGNGSDALILSLIALDIKKGDNVICVANAGFYSSAAILSVGAIPNYVDVDWKSMNMDANLIEKSIDENTKAIIVTHLYGLMADVISILEISKKFNIPIIEDCAQAHGAEMNNKKAGTWGLMGTFSFYPTKNLGGFGDSGAIITSSEKIYKKIQALRQYGWTRKYFIGKYLGKNSRMDEIQAAILRVKLSHLNELNEKRRNMAILFKNNLDSANFTLPYFENKEYVAHLFVVRSKNREKVQEKLKLLNISCEIHYPILDNEQEYFNNKSELYIKNNLDISYECCNQVLSIPCHPFLNSKEMDEILDALKT
tara:strand:+ start:87 stop:1184 length:1098 start_codon:yes stop_codon:yes gene_type:complete